MEVGRRRLLGGIVPGLTALFLARPKPVEAQEPVLDIVEHPVQELGPGGTLRDVNHMNLRGDRTDVFPPTSNDHYIRVNPDIAVGIPDNNAVLGFNAQRQTIIPRDRYDVLWSNSKELVFVTGNVYDGSSKDDVLFLRADIPAYGRAARLCVWRQRMVNGQSVRTFLGWLTPDLEA